MSSVELRNKIYKKLENVDDDLLKEVLSFIEFETEEGLYTLSDTQKSAIDEGRRQIKNGNSFTNEEVNKELDAWLNK